MRFHFFLRLCQGGHFEDGVQAKVLQEFRSRGIKDRTPGTLGAAGFQDQAFVQQALHHTVAVDAADGPGRPILYSTTPEFLQHFGLNSILEMPPLAQPEEEAETHDEMLKG